MIRVATEADRAAILALHLASWRASYGIELPEAVLRDVLPGYLAEKWAERDFGAGQVTLAAPGSGGLDGFACALTDRETPLIDNLHVRPGLRGARLGGRLLGAMLDALRGTAPRAELTVLARNDGARRFYAAQGGRDLGPETDRLVGKPVIVHRIAFDLG